MSDTIRFSNATWQQGFVSLPREVLHDSTLSAGARLAWAALASYAWTEGKVYPGQERLASDLGVSRRSVVTYVQELEDRRLITKERRGLGQTNTYLLHIPEVQTLHPSSADPAHKVEEVEVEEVKNPPTPRDKPEATGLFDYWRDKCGHPRARFTADRRRAVNGRLKDGYAVEDIQLAIRNAANCAFVNEAGVKFDDLEWICRSGSKLEGFMNRDDGRSWREKEAAARAKRREWNAQWHEETAA